MPLDRKDIKKELLKKYGKKLKKDILESNIEGLVDEYIEKNEFIQKYGTVKFATKDEMKWWFQDNISVDKFEVSPGVFEDVMEIKVDNIYFKEKAIGKQIYKNFYKYCWKPDEPIPEIIKNLIKIHKIAMDIKVDKRTRNFESYRLSDLALLGAIRYYHLERTPYFCRSQINKIITSFRKALDVIDKIETGKFKNEKIIGELPLFGAFQGKEKEELYKCFTRD